MLWYGNHVLEAGGIAIDSSGRREHDVGNIVLGHRAKKRNATPDVDAVVLERDLARFTDSLFAMDVLEPIY